MSALDAIFMRRSVRSYTGQKLDEPTIRSLLDAAAQAPTAMHVEPWACVVIQDDATLKRFSDRAKGSWVKEVIKYRDLHIPGDEAISAQFANPECCVFYDAGTLIVICEADGPVRGRRLLACGRKPDAGRVRHGVGTCCIGSAVPALNTVDAKAELGIPLDVTAVAAIIVGVPSGSAAPVSRRDPRDHGAGRRPGGHDDD